MDSSAKWLDAKQAGKHLGRHPETMRKNARLGKISPFLITHGF